MTRLSGVWSLVCLVPLGLMCGCGGGAGDRLSTVPAGGKVYVNDEPAGAGMLTLSPISSGEDDTRPEIGGAVQADGTFKLTTYEEGDGAPAGEYTATFSEGAGDAGSADPDAMMAMMGGATTNSITITIPEGGDESLELKFTSTKPKQSKPGAPLGT